MSLSLMAGPIAVIDVETTGLYPFRHDRVIEVAAVVVGADWRIEREFVSLVNPERDIGPSSIHGLTSEDILHAPQFGEIAGLLLDVLSGTVAIAAHNVRFDLQFLEREFSRLGHDLPDCFSICTMLLAGGGKLTDCCDDYGISPEGEAHHALADARAAARLLACLLSDGPSMVQELRQLAPIHWPTIPITGKQPVTRDESRRRQTEPPTFLQRLLGQMDDHDLPTAADGAVMAYWALLDRVLEDRHVDDSEADALVETAAKWGLSGGQIGLAHRDYLDQLAIAAVADGITTDAERRDLKLIARLLGQEKRDLDEILSEAAAKASETHHESATDMVGESSLSGMRVCFTGELQGLYDGRMISRQLAEELATRAGLIAVDSVTKKLDLLVLADPHSQSGKAKRAHRYSIRIMQELVFWKAIGVEVG
ncbi:MAG: 3'-5' exoribonuclease [Chloroflexi bacterium]|nr:3'-5' exoribonuclease [Chloroflexota bacterium]